MPTFTEECAGQLNRLTESETLRSSERLCQLLSYLAERSNLGTADQLKEYTIGVEAFHKPASYNPREDSTVRIQAARLRQKLMEYYQGEGKDDLIIAELPKGHFKLSWSKREQHAGQIEENHRSSRYALPAVLLMLLVCSLGWAVFETVQTRSLQRQISSSQEVWTPALADLWRPFIDTDRPLFIVVSAPPFLKFGNIYIRDYVKGQPQEVEATKIANDLERLQPNKYQLDYRFTNFGNLTAAFLFGKVLGPRKAGLSIVNSSETSWRQLSEGNVLFIGASRNFIQQPQIPIEQPLTLETEFGVHNPHPQTGEKNEYRDEVSPDGQNGITYSLISYLPGPLGQDHIETFAGSNVPGIQAAVEWFTNPANAKALIEKLRGSSGAFPPYYQVVLMTKFHDYVPIETSFVLARLL